MKRIGFISEVESDARICVLPSTIANYNTKFDLEILVERGIGNRLGILDSKFAEAGARVVSRDDVLYESDLLSFLNPPDSELEQLNNKVFAGLMNPKNPRIGFDQYLYKNVTIFSLDLIPEISSTDDMNVLASLDSLSGERAVKKGLELFGATGTNLSSAAGPMMPVKILVLGAGKAGQKAITVAAGLGADVAYDKSKITGWFDSKVYCSRNTAENETNLKYPVTHLTKDKIQLENTLSNRIKQADIIICSVFEHNKKSPILITKQQISSMRPGSVLVDIASHCGGNTELTVDQELIIYNDIKIVGAGNLTTESPLSTSKIISENYRVFIEYFIAHHQIEGDQILNACKVIERGIPVHNMFKPQPRIDKSKTKNQLHVQPHFTTNKMVK